MLQGYTSFYSENMNTKVYILHIKLITYILYIKMRMSCSYLFKGHSNLNMNHHSNFENEYSKKYIPISKFFIKNLQVQFERQNKNKNLYYRKCNIKKYIN